MSDYKFYDPIKERWCPMPAAPAKTTGMDQDHYKRADRLIRQSHFWEAIEATATATQMSKPCPAGSEKAEDES